MHKIFYSSGFIYYPPTQQILLHQQSLDPIASSWTLFRQQYDDSLESKTAFKNMLFMLLQREYANVYPIYSYEEEFSHTTHVVLYAVANELEEFATRNGHTFQWFSFKELTKLPLDEKTKHDIIVGQRVIGSTERKFRGEQTLE